LKEINMPYGLIFPIAALGLAFRFAALTGVHSRLKITVAVVAIASVLGLPALVWPYLPMVLQFLVSMFVLAYMQLFADSMNLSSNLQVHLSAPQRRMLLMEGATLTVVDALTKESYVLLAPNHRDKPYTNPEQNAVAEPNPA
jgi:hypothetical protein